MLSKEAAYDSLVESGIQKGEIPLWRTFLLGMLAGFFVGLGYIGYLAVLGSKTSDDLAFLQKAIAASLFPVGLLLIIFLGGSLFTSDSLSFLGYIEKKTKLRALFPRWGIVLLGNFAGAFLIAAIAASFMKFGDPKNHLNTVLGEFIAKKQSHRFVFKDIKSLDILGKFGSAILCNVLVAGTVWAAKMTKNSAGKFFIVFLPITLFAIVGFEHIVANFFIFWLGVFFNGAGNVDTHVGIMIVANFIPVTLGNFFGGGILLPLFIKTTRFW